MKHFGLFLHREILQYGFKGKSSKWEWLQSRWKNSQTIQQYWEKTELKLYSLILAWVKPHQNYCLWISLWSCAKMDALQLHCFFNEKWHHKSRVCSCSQAAHESWDLGYGKSHWLWHLLGNEISIVGFKCVIWECSCTYSKWKAILILFVKQKSTELFTSTS